MKMNKKLIFFLVILLPIIGSAQIKKRVPTSADRSSLAQPGTSDNQVLNQQQVISRKEKPPITDYQIISAQRDTTYLDTTLTIYKEYKFNYLRKDDFELLPFANVGQPYNSLSYDFNKTYSLTPGFGARAKHFNYFEVSDISYYHVPTPLTELYYKTAYEQGQQLDAFFTVNLSPDFNFSIAYKGVNSLGKYQRVRSSSGNFRSTINYTALQRRYSLLAHFVSQDLENQENGGLDPLAVQGYYDEVEEFDDRAVIDVNLEDAQNVLYGKRFYVNQVFSFKKEDSTTVNNFQVGHIMNFTHKKYRYEQATSTDLFGETFRTGQLRDEVRLDHLYNEAFLKLKNRNLGELSFKGALTHYNYGYNSIVNFETSTVTNRLVGDVFSVGAGYKNQYKGFVLDGKAMLNVAGEMDGYSFAADLSYALNEENSVSVGLLSNSSQPNFNFLLYQSDYINYNWQNNFNNEKTNALSFRLNSRDIANVEASYNQINDYTYFTLNADSLVKPVQSNEQIDFLKVKISRQFSYGKFSLDNTVLLQEVLNGDNALNVPQFVTRNSLYYQDEFFRKALFLQTGFIFKYFTDYRMNGYDPVLAEFYVQNEEQFNGFPTLDFFVNTKIQQTRIFFKLQHLNAAFTGNNNFSSPAHPYRDFAIRFGLVWNFFL